MITPSPRQHLSARAAGARPAGTDLDMTRNQTTTPTPQLASLSRTPTTPGVRAPPTRGIRPDRDQKFVRSKGQNLYAELSAPDELRPIYVGGTRLASVCWPVIRLHTGRHRRCSSSQGEKSSRRFRNARSGLTGMRGSSVPASLLCPGREQRIQRLRNGRDERPDAVMDETGCQLHRGARIVDERRPDLRPPGAGTCRVTGDR